ncbi:hypothetical protein RchiOBHm_Chr4g0423521 [Rosa chinensis]|uniref:Uncharacterized protein n=1 Tax=Rosa chinensis TaxID=74649 RepID=A0A2P6QYL4_ROSCH|nr:hypothetical protein RchiOBHm_Chr4g0423521 [Rosa chinensis]
MAFERLPKSHGVFLNCKAPQVLSESHTIIEDCRYSTSSMTPQKVFLPSDQYFNATKDEYRGSSWPNTTSHATIVKDCRYSTSPMTPQNVFLPSEEYFNATKDEYRGSSWPNTTSHASTSPPLPRPSQGYYHPQVVKMEYHQVPNHIKRYGNIEYPPSAERPINSTEAAKKYGGYVITEFRNKNSR